MYKRVIVYSTFMDTREPLKHESIQPRTYRYWSNNINYTLSVSSPISVQIFLSFHSTRAKSTFLCVPSI